MTYTAIADIVESASLRRRIIAAVAAEQIPGPDVWVAQRIWSFAAQPGWSEAWTYAVENWGPDYNPDTGARPGVISDTMILAAVQALNT